MKTKIKSQHRPSAGYALIMVLVMGAISILVLAGTMRRTGSTAILNDRNNQYMVNLNAAEAATEKVIARMAYDFQGGLATVTANLDMYRTNIPSTVESPFWGNFQFSNGQGQANRTYVGYLTNYGGPLPSQYPGLFAASNSPVYRVLSNVRAVNGRYLAMTNAVQEDLLFALVPLSQYAIFYHGLLEFSTCATMTVNGRTHANSNIYVGSSSPLTFNGTVTASGKISSPANNGAGGWPFPGNVSFNGTPNYKTNVPAVALSISMTNTHSLIDIPPSTELVNSIQGQHRLYNQAQIVLLISNTTVTARIQTSPALGQLPATDPSPTTISASWTNDSPASWVQTVISTNFPFLSMTNTFLDQREDKTILAAQVDVGKYRDWILTNPPIGGASGKFPVNSGNYPLILYVSDNRTNSVSQLSAVRIANGLVPPQNGGIGWSIATPNPLYVWGNYNCTNAAFLGSVNTSATIPSALISDALTILSTSWNDTTSWIINPSGPGAAGVDTVNAAILTGVKTTTSSASSGFSGGVHNLPRLLEDWSSSHLWLNTSIINLFSSTKATGQFVTPGSGSYYVPPTRHFSFDPNFMNPNRVPPGIPCALVAIRMNWAVPPPNTVTYNVAP